MSIIDFHTHAFPKEIFEYVMSVLVEEGDMTPSLDGSLDSLLRSMDESGIDSSVLCSIATKSDQFNSILQWSKKIRSDRIIPLPSIHPYDPDFDERLKIIYNEGFKGLKLHPYYQDFYLDDEKVFPLYEKILEYDLLLVSHTGFDLAYPKRENRCDPQKILYVLERYPDLKFITTHFGGWDDWDRVIEYLIGKPIYMEISFSFQMMPEQKVEEMINNHPEDYILFGTDSPWTSQIETLNKLKGLNISQSKIEKILFNNAKKLLN